MQRWTFIDLDKVSLIVDDLHFEQLFLGVADVDILRKVSRWLPGCLMVWNRTRPKWGVEGLRESCVPALLI